MTQEVYTQVPNEEPAIINVSRLAGMEICPTCGSDETEGESFDTEDSDRVSQEMSCRVCESQWFNYYKLCLKHVVYSG